MTASEARCGERLRQRHGHAPKDKALSRWEGGPQADRLEASNLVRPESAMLSSYTPYVIEKLTSQRHHVDVHAMVPSRRRSDRASPPGRRRAR